MTFLKEKKSKTLNLMLIKRSDILCPSGGIGRHKGLKIPR